MVRRFFIYLGLISLLLASCAQAPLTEGAAQNFANACDKANNGKRVSVEGFLRFPDSFTDSQSVLLRLYESNSYSGTPIGVQIDFGTQANQVEKVPEQYTDNDLKVHLANGQVAPFGTKVKVSGQVYYPLTGQDFDCGLSNPLVELGQ